MAFLIELFCMYGLIQIFLIISCQVKKRRNNTIVFVHILMYCREKNKICIHTTYIQINTSLKFVQKVVLDFVIYYVLLNEKLCCILIP